LLQKKNASLSEELTRSDRDKASLEGEAAAVKEVSSCFDFFLSWRLSGPYLFSPFRISSPLSVDFTPLEKRSTRCKTSSIVSRAPFPASAVFERLIFFPPHSCIARSASLAEIESRFMVTSTQKDGKLRELDNLVRTNAQLEAKLRSASQRSLDMTKVRPFDFRFLPFDLD
jgi:hypothetical protein